MWKNEMRSVARRAGRRYGEAFLQQSLAVHALCIVLKNVGLWNVALTLDGRSLPVAFAAHIRYVHRSDGGGGIFDTSDLMAAVAVLASRGEFVASSYGLSVPAFGVKLPLFFVTLAALGALQRNLVRQFLSPQVRVTIDAHQTGMNGSRKHPVVHKK